MNTTTTWTSEPTSSPVILQDYPLWELITMQEIIELYRKALRHITNGHFYYPARYAPSVGECRLVFTVGGRSTGQQGGDICGFRVYRSNEGASEATMVFDSESGHLLGMYLGSYLGEWRTGAIGGVAIDLNCPPEVNKIAIIGSGRQARTQLLAATVVRDFNEIMVYSPNPGHRTAFAESMGGMIEQPIHIATGVEDAVQGADVIVCATSSKRPLLKAAWLSRQAHINHVGCKIGSQSEIPTRIYQTAGSICTDTLPQARSMGMRFVGANQLYRTKQLSDLIDTSEVHPKDGVSLYVSLGLAGTEVVLAAELFKRFQKSGST